MTFVMNFMKKRIGNERGVTLVELLAVIVILGIISAVAVPLVFNQMNDAQVKADEASRQTILDAAERYFVVNSVGLKKTDSDGPWLVSTNKLVTDGYIQKDPLVKTTDATPLVITGVEKNRTGPLAFKTGGTTSTAVTP